MRKKVILLTKSLKNGGYCVAGIDYYTGQWIRLVSGNQETKGALEKCGVPYKPLDIVIVDNITPMPIQYQPENYLIEEPYGIEGFYAWKKIGEYDINKLVERYANNTNRYILYNNNVHFCKEEVAGVEHSLEFVEITQVVIYTIFNEVTQKNKTKANFIYNGTSYNGMSVTDPDYYDARKILQIKKCLVCLVHRRNLTTMANIINSCLKYSAAKINYKAEGRM